MAPPPWLSWQAVWAGKTAAIRSCARMRSSAGGTRLPPRLRSSVSDRIAFHRQRVSNIGACSAACTSSSSTSSARNIENTVSSGKLCWGPSDSTIPSSVAAACSSKSKDRQNRLRSAIPQARLIRPPNGAWMMSCMPPASSKNRSATTRVWVGTPPSTAAPATT